MSALHAVTSLGQSIWSDQVSRAMLEGGELARLVTEDGITGVTSNPTIFHKAITGSGDYDAKISVLARAGADVGEIYTDLVARDIIEACDTLSDVHSATNGVDGYVSVEVSPELAADTEATIDDARAWVKRIDRPNLLVKVPATPEGIPAIGQLTSEGISVNVTLIFSLGRYREVIAAYLDGLEALSATGGSLSDVASVASFFVSRVDSEVDSRLMALGTDQATELRGTAAIANARAAYGDFTETFSGERWAALADKGARVQRPLWASTSTKDPTYRDTMYVDTLVAPDTVNTMPIQTIDAYRDHGDPAPEIISDEDVADARATLAELGGVGVDYADVVDVLEREGVDKFAASYRDLIADLVTKRASLA